MKKTRWLAAFLVSCGTVTASTYAQNNLRDSIRGITGDKKANERAQGEGREVAMKALEQAYGKEAKINITGEHDVNGVHLYTAEISRGGNSASAIITSGGHLVETGWPGGGQAMPPLVREMTQGLFHVSPNDVEMIDTHYYFVRVASGGHEYVMTFDATGRVQQIRSTLQVDALNPQTEGEAAGNERGAIERLVRERFGGANVRDVRRASHYPGYFDAYFNSPDGAGMTTIDAKNDVVFYQMPGRVNSFPQPVQRTINELLKGDQVKNAGTGSERFFRVSQNVGGEEITVLVHANGDIEKVAERQGGASTASHRTPGR